MKDSKKKVNKLLAESERWGPGKRNQEPMTKLSKKEGDLILEKGSLELITIRLPSETIAKLKSMAEKEGIKYQPYLRKDAPPQLPSETVTKMISLQYSSNKDYSETIEKIYHFT